MLISTKVKLKKFTDREEKTHFAKPLFVTCKCPQCLKYAFTFVIAFEYYDNQEQWLQTTTLRQAVCKTCFQTQYYPVILKRYYKEHD